MNISSGASFLALPDVAPGEILIRVLRAGLNRGDVHMRDGDYNLNPGEQSNQLPILPMSYALSHKLTIKSWDRFQIPLPFTRCDLHLGDLIEVPRSYREKERAEVLERIRDSMMALTKD